MLVCVLIEYFGCSLQEYGAYSFSVRQKFMQNTIGVRHPQAAYTYVCSSLEGADYLSMESVLESKRSRRPVSMHWKVQVPLSTWTSMHLLALRLRPNRLFSFLSAISNRLYSVEIAY